MSVGGVCDGIGLHSFVLTLFKTYLTSSNRKYNRVGMMLLKTVMELDFQEYETSSQRRDYLFTCPIEQYAWKGASRRRV